MFGVTGAIAQQKRREEARRAPLFKAKAPTQPTRLPMRLTMTQIRT